MRVPRKPAEGSSATRRCESLPFGGGRCSFLQNWPSGIEPLQRAGGGRRLRIGTPTAFHRSGAAPYATQLSAGPPSPTKFVALPIEAAAGSPRMATRDPGGIPIALHRCVHDGAGVSVIGRPLAAADAVLCCYAAH